MAIGSKAMVRTLIMMAIWLAGGVASANAVSCFNAAFKLQMRYQGMCFVLSFIDCIRSNNCPFVFDLEFFDFPNIAFAHTKKVSSPDLLGLHFVLLSRINYVTIAITFICAPLLANLRSFGLSEIRLSFLGIRFLHRMARH